MRNIVVYEAEIFVKQSIIGGIYCKTQLDFGALRHTIGSFRLHFRTFPTFRYGILRFDRVRLGQMDTPLRSPLRKRPQWGETISNSSVILEK